MNLSTRITNVVLVMAGMAVIPLLSSCGTSDLAEGESGSKKKFFGLFGKKDTEEVVEAATGDTNEKTTAETPGTMEKKPASTPYTTPPDRIVRPSENRLVVPVNPQPEIATPSTPVAPTTPSTPSRPTTPANNASDVTVTTPETTGRTGSVFDRVPSLTSETPNTPRPSLTEDGFTPLVPEPRLPEEESIIPPTGN